VAIFFDFASQNQKKWPLIHYIISPPKAAKYLFETASTPKKTPRGGCRREFFLWRKASLSARLAPFPGRD
jgi:hypothetical protein